MPRKPKVEKKRITVVVNGAPITVTLHPPGGNRVSWYAYWSGLVSSKSTGQVDFAEAVKAVEGMLRNGGTKTVLSDTVLSDEEFEAIQRAHYAKAKNQRTAQKTLRALVEAISAFRQITGLKPITIATAADCERFQQEALKLPRNFRSKHPKSRDDAAPMSPSSVDKWSRCLQAAFERANIHSGKKCIRSVVPESKLLKENPWHQFTWIECRERPIRQFRGEELLSLLDYLESHFPGVSVATALAKTYLWSWGRRVEVTGLRWDDVRVVGNEYHFASIGKAGVTKWFRVPAKLYEELQSLKTDSRFVFAAYNEQLRRFHRASRHPWRGNRITSEFSPENLGDWFYRRVKRWSASIDGGSAYVHVFRKTSLQYARHGEDLSRQVAADARLTESVMMTSYVLESDPEMRQKSNRTFRRIALSLPPDVAKRYGYEPSVLETLKDRHTAAVQAEDWELAARIAGEIAALRRAAG